MPPPVKPRTYDASRRRAAARERRETILDAAREQMLRDGYAATTVAGIATAAGVSSETIYKAYGGKTGVVRALHQRALEGAGTVPAEQRSDRLRGVSTGHELVAGWARLASEVAPRGAPLVILLRDAAASDPQARAVLEDIDQSRLVRMRDNARALLATGDVRPGLTLTEVTDVLFTVSSAEMYELLVIRRRWTARRFTRFQRETMAAALLTPRP
ncbi:MAG TPA: helix-turn-helix domain-containing protein [Nocardioidaceae bacterium]|nr:helix-turn-helix domain-containing protein [Nocardioidaceae bacterium]